MPLQCRTAGRRSFARPCSHSSPYYIELDVCQRAGLKTVIDDSLTVWQSELTVSLSVNSLCQLFNCPVNVVVLVCHPLAEVGISPVYALSLVWPYPLTGFCRSTYRDAQWGLTAVVGCGTDGV